MINRNRRRIANIVLAALIMCGGGLRHASAEQHLKTRIGTACVMTRDASGVTHQTCR